MQGVMEAILTDRVHSNLQHFMYGNAIFLCERLCAEFPCEGNLQLLAGCYLRNNQAYCAYHILKGTQMAQSRYLFALSCFQMDLLKEAESALCPTNDSRSEVPNSAASHYLLGLIYRCSDRRKNAIHHFKQALSIDPLMWSAYEELCKIGHLEETCHSSDEAAVLSLQKQYLNCNLGFQQLQLDDNCNSVSSPSLRSGDVSPRHLKHVHGKNNIAKDILANHHGITIPGASVQLQHSNGSSSNTSFYITPPQIAAQLSVPAPPPIYRNIQLNYNIDNSAKSTLNTTIQAPRRKFLDEGKLRKISGRLFNDSGPRRSSRLASEGVSHVTSSITAVVGNGNVHSSKYPGSTKSGSVTLRTSTSRKGQAWANECLDEDRHHDSFDDSRASMTSASTSSSLCGDLRTGELSGIFPIDDTTTNSPKFLDEISEILGLFKVFREGYRLSFLYRCQEALEVYLKLPHKHYNTAWVLSQVGKAHFELVNYVEADRIFSLARLAFPYTMEGMDIYSTVLYHLKEVMKLSYLAKDLTAIDRLAPQSWCAMGNCYSLQKDHETALKNFQRAVQLNPKFAYAHTLCGHEHAALEDFENSIKCYQKALQADTRHYNAWYGLGMVYLRQEKYEFAEHHFRMAYGINRHSSIIMCYLGTTLHAMKRNADALRMIDNSIAADKKNPLPMYQKANILSSLGDYANALEVLEELQEYAPRESSIYALMGKIYKSQNMIDKAMLHFGLALDLKPPVVDAATIKAAMEKLHVPDELQEFV